MKRADNSAEAIKDFIRGSWNRSIPPRNSKHTQRQSGRNPEKHKRGGRKLIGHMEVIDRHRIRVSTCDATCRVKHSVETIVNPDPTEFYSMKQKKKEERKKAERGRLEEDKHEDGHQV